MAPFTSGPRGTPCPAPARATSRRLRRSSAAARPDPARRRASARCRRGPPRLARQVFITGPPRTCVRPSPSSTISNWPQVWLCQFDRLPFGNFRRVVRTLVASTEPGVPPMKLLVWPATQIGAAIARRMARSFARDMLCVLCSAFVPLALSRDGHCHIVVGEDRAVAGDRAKHVGSRLLERHLRDPLVVRAAVRGCSTAATTASCRRRACQSTSSSDPG